MQEPGDLLIGLSVQTLFHRSVTVVRPGKVPKSKVKNASRTGRRDWLGSNVRLGSTKARLVVTLEMPECQISSEDRDPTEVQQ